ncbi:hypothetical protein J2T10_004567 [Paenarthrobacter nicotinovorans]|uniref:Uncharacterized protein n=1 Tax=Paenarthrobacter nicotinovorans TaxID=29320 RepID=A0ABT9TV06_PAENI|nr:hypothetical protein [Paenarthrobacter nicotinovorans]MDQ0104891.1 hypothetical protein [Paenarthrobacter nicotinovorans]GAT89673.1 hypothetical protein CVCC1112_4332 [Paenarthrobacter nicotinovorans]
MGNFGRFVYTDLGSSGGADADPALVLELHDSDFVAVDFHPKYSGNGRFYLGFQPRDYFEDPAASDPVDIDREAEAFQQWVNKSLGRSIAVADILPFIAEESVEEPEDVFVEDTMERFLGLIGLAMPAELS